MNNSTESSRNLWNNVFYSNTNLSSSRLTNKPLAFVQPVIRHSTNSQLYPSKSSSMQRRFDERNLPK